MTDTINVLITEEEINIRVREIAKQIDSDYAGKSVTFLITLKGACFFACELAKRMTIPVFMEYIRAVSYKGKSSTSTINTSIDIPNEAISGKHIIIVEDIIDTGRTLTSVKEMIRIKEPASIAVCSLLDKHDSRIVPLEGDYIGFTIGNDFVVGYGMDLNQKYRNLPYIGVVQLTPTYIFQ